MAYHRDSMGKIHDDMGGAALSLPSWPKDAVPISDAEAAVALAPLPEKARTDELSALFAQWQSNLAALQFAWVAALREAGESETDRKANIAAEIEELQIQYQTDVAAVKSKYSEV